jgi:predicted ABC-type ATPase
MGYAIELLYPWVEETNLIKRVNDRQTTTGQFAAPVEQISETYNSAMTNLRFLTPYIDKLCIYNNNGDNMQSAMCQTYTYTGKRVDPLNPGVEVICVGGGDGIPSLGLNACQPITNQPI